MSSQPFDVVETIDEKLSQGDTRFRALIQNSLDIITILDINGKICYESPSVQRVVGYSPEELFGKNVFDFIHPDDKEHVLEAFHKVIQNSPIFFQTAEFRFQCKNGSWCFLEVNGTNLLNDPCVSGIVINSRDITERKKIEIELEKNESKFRSLVQNCSDIITLISWDGKISYQSPSTRGILGFEIFETLGKIYYDFIHPDDIARFSQTILDVKKNSFAPLSVEYRFRNKEGSWLYLDSIINNLLDDPSVEGIVINSRDISDRKLSESELLYLATHDPLTKLPNRSLFAEWLDNEFKLTHRFENRCFAVLFLDLDRFKLINDSFGHAVGDQLLIGIADRLKASIREIDKIARLSGDEFAILLVNVETIHNVVGIAERIYESLQAPFNLEGREIFSTASIGIAISNTKYNHPEELLRDADIALYRAKELGKSRFEIFDSEMHRRAVKLLQIETSLRRSIDQGELQVFFQPIISLRTGKVKGAEALLRLNNSPHGLISPIDFIPIAEETGLIHSIGLWVLSESCRHALIWDKYSNFETPLSVSVNVSAKQFSQLNLIEHIDEILSRTGLDPSRLCLEITEGVLIENAEAATVTFSQLRAMGVQLYMDDFGTGYSSLSYLHRFPVNMLKIDRSFVSSMKPGNKNFEITQAII
ncbi:MAG: EAL domain-containing protein, partial [Thermosynechococcaceae cyanobacterium]